MAKNKDKKKEDSLSEVESALTKTEKFIEHHQKSLTYIVGGIIIIVAGYLGFIRFYVHPMVREAQEQMYMAEQYFEKDSFNLALHGDGNYLGFLDVIDDYGITKIGNLAKYYAGISYLHIGEYEEAINYLDGFKTKDLLLAPIVAGAKGDAYLELKENAKALAAYKKAYSFTNELTTPVYLLKAGKLLESDGKLEEALKVYREIKEKYSESNEGRTIDKYIARIEVKKNK